MNFWRLSTDRHSALTGIGLTVTVWQLTVLHLHTCVGIYAESISRRRRFYLRYHEQRYRDSEIRIYVDNGSARYDGKEFQELLSKIRREKNA